MQAFSTTVVAAVVVLMIAVESVLLRAGGWDMTSLLLWESMIGLNSLSGLLAAWRQPHNPFGWLLVWAGLATGCAGLQLAPYPAIGLIGDICHTLPLATLVHLVLAFPHGRLPDRVSRWVVGGTYFVALVLQAPIYLFSGDGPVAISNLPEVVKGATSAQRVVGLLTLAAALAVLLRRRRIAGPDRRQRMGPLSWYGPVALTAMITVIVLSAVFSRYPEPTAYAQSTILLGLPILFLVGLLTGAFGRAGELQEFLKRVGSGQLRPEHLDDAVARALGDPRAHVVYSAGEADAFFYADGSVADLGSDELMRPVRYGSEVAGAIVYDANSVVDEHLLAAIAQVCALAVDHQRVVAGLRAALLDVEKHAIALREAQYRILQASDVERRRIARDLHDGVQQSIVVLGLRVVSLTRGADDPGQVRAAAADLQAGMAALLKDFRTLVHGIMPASLTDRGIVPAIRELSERTAVPLTVRSSGLNQRLPEAVESTVYFVVSEIVTNAIKHAGATGVWVDLEYLNDGTLSTQVRDDGHGGAVMNGGGGLQGLRDRVLALNGSLMVNSAAGQGTVVKALIPCG